jgi:hypothetical protein
MHSRAAIQFRSGALPLASPPWRPPPLGNPTHSRPAVRNSHHRPLPVRADAPTSAHLVGIYAPPDHVVSGPPTEVILPSPAELLLEKR